MINELYSLVFQMARKLEKRFPSSRVSSENKSIQTFWDIIPELLEDYGDEKVHRWNQELMPPTGTLYIMFTEKIMKLPEKFITGAGDEIIDHTNQCLIDIFRIPLRSEPTIVNILRVAFCNGRLNARLRASDFPDGLIKAYKDFQMHQLINYADPSEYEGRELPEKLLPNLKSKLLSEFKHMTDD